MRIFRLLWLAPGSSALSMSKVCDLVCKLLASSLHHRKNRRRPPSDSVCRAGMSRLPRSLETNGLVTTTQPSAAPVTSPCTEYVPSFARVGGHDRCGEREFASTSRSDTPEQLSSLPQDLADRAISMRLPHFGRAGQRDLNSGSHSSRATIDERPKIGGPFQSTFEPVKTLRSGTLTPCLINEKSSPSP